MSVCKVIKKLPCPPHKKLKLCRRRKKKKKTGNSFLKQLRRLRQQIARITRVYQSRINRLSAEISRLTDFTNQIRNDVNILQAQVSALATAPGIRDVLLARLNTSIVVETDAGAISGTLIEVGTDYVAILEPTGAIVLVPLTDINTFV
ncbi:uncharacterized protein DUF2642 [Paenibacillus prosopidis]|uniref:Uncharacterized protein DUF2642 n=1 Tax=Paenibacillus prosopidis TaxID=630520 RepID=A0A368W344_9BACL|nr:uncharacterized protein DUF2642 [Paenibacillus prosopidis]